MDYFYHYYNNCDHSTYLSSPIDQCACSTSTFLLSLNIMLLAIVIYSLLMEKVTVIINPSPKLPFISFNECSSPDQVMISVEKNAPNDSISSTLDQLRLPVKDLSPKVMPESVTSPLLELNNERLINLESSTFSESLESPSENLLLSENDSSGSSGSLRRKLIKPDFSLSFFDSSISSNFPLNDEDSRIFKGKDEDDDSLKEFNVLIHTNDNRGILIGQDINAIPEAFNNQIDAPMTFFQR